MNKTIKSNWAVMLFALTFSVFYLPVFAEILDTTTQESPHEFTHNETGFPLTGAHLTTECASCHVGGIMKGTPRNCAGCHSRGARVIATTMSINHVVTNNEACEVCHTNTSTFLGARFSHNNVTIGNCVTCHNGRVSTGRPASHISAPQTTYSCDKCHRTVSWYPTNFDHSGVVPGSCATQCHNGKFATGKPGSHTSVLKATSTCDTCHRYYSWLPTFYNHSAVVPGTCSTCHNGSSATGRPANHNGAKILLACDSCHITAAWMPAAYNHIGIAPGTCLTCHTAERPTSHVTRGYVSSCDACHSIGAAWSFNHAMQQGKHTCNSCHSRRDHHGSGTQPCDVCHSVNGWGG